MESVLGVRNEPLRYANVGPAGTYEGLARNTHMLFDLLVARENPKGFFAD